MKQQPMNVLFIMSDQHRHDLLSCLGHPIVQTPNLDRLAARSAVFNNAYCPEPLCIPSRVSCFTGRFPHNTGAIRNKTGEYITLGDHSFIEDFRNAGYRTGLAGKNHAFAEDYIHQWFDYDLEYHHTGRISPGGDQYDHDYVAFLKHDYRSHMGLRWNKPLPFEPEHLPAHRTALAANEFISQTAGEPFFLLASFADPHFPHVASEPYYSMYDTEHISLTEAVEIDWDKMPFTFFFALQLVTGVGSADYTEAQIKRLLATYYAQISYIDHSIGMILNLLEEQGLTENTIIVYCSDHGDYAGRYGVLEKMTLHECLVRIPLMIHLPGMNESISKDAQVYNMDVLPTVMEYLGLKARSVDARSFLSVLLDGKDDHREEIYTEGGYTGYYANGIPQDDAGREFAQIRENIALDWDRYIDDFHAFRREGEAGSGGHNSWSKNLLLRGDVQIRPIAIKRGHWKYYFIPGDTDALFDLKADPMETQNLCLHPNHQEKRFELRQRVLDWAGKK